MSGGPEHPPDTDLVELLELLYQLPVGLVQMTQSGRVERINPAAVRKLMPAVRQGEDLNEILPLLRRVAPDLVANLLQFPRRAGPVGRGHVIRVPGGPQGETLIEVRSTRVDDDRLLLALIEISEERRLAQREHEIAVQLQEAMLGRIDDVAGTAVSVTYRSADTQMQVGGDWYDVIKLPGARTGLVIGDVVGHSLQASVAMGQLRAAVRSVARWTDDPAELLERADSIAEGIDGAQCATMAYAILDHRTGRLSYGSAGHPPIMVLRAERADYLGDGLGPPLACTTAPSRSTATTLLAPGDTVVLYTDGLIERRRESLEIGLAQLRASAEALRHVPTAELSERLAAGMLSDRYLDDDLCVMAMRYVAAYDSSEPTISDGVAPSRAPEAAARRAEVTTLHLDEIVYRTFDRLPAMAAYWNADLRNVVANRAYVEWFGVDPEHMAGRHIRDVLGEDVYALNLPFLEGALRGEEQHFERALVDASGRLRRTQATYLPDTVDGDTVGFFVLVTEVPAPAQSAGAAMEPADF